MKFYTYSLSMLVALGITVSSAEAFTVARDTVKNSVSPLAIAIATTTIQKKSVKMRTVSYISGKLKTKGYVVRDARRKGQIYIFRASKNGFVLLISVDARNSKIVGVKILSAPAGKQPRAKASAGNRFVDETYEFGYGVSEAEYLSYYEFTQAEYLSTVEYTVYALAISEFVSYEAISTEATDASITYEADDLDQGEAGDAEGNTEAAIVAEDMPDDTSADEAPAEDTTAEPSTDEPAADAPSDQPTDDSATDCPPDGDGTDACPPPEPTIEDTTPDEPQADDPQADEPQADEPQQDEVVPEEPQDEAPAEDTPSEDPPPDEPQ